MNTILCIGTLIADIINEKVPRLPNEGECVTTEVSFNLGGNAYSSSVNIKRLSSPDTEVHCLSLIGRDSIGSLFENALKEEGIICHLSKVSGKRTSCNIILQEKGKDRRYLFCEGANSCASKEAIIKTVGEIKPEIIILGEMPSLGIVKNHFIELISHIKSEVKSLICLDTLVNAEEDYSWLAGHWSKIDIVHCNFGEGLHISKTSTHPEICRWFLDNGVMLPVVSDGDKGCYFGFKNAVEHVPPFEAEEMDATGAGDAMMAGILTRLVDSGKNINNMDVDVVREALVFGSACGSYAVGSMGCVSDICREKIADIVSSSPVSL